MHESTTNFTNRLVYPELSYVLMGIIFEVHNKLGTKYQEKRYQRAIETKLKILEILYQKEAKIDIQFENQPLGEFFVDFIIDNKIILEIKKVWKITKRYQTGFKIFRGDQIKISHYC